MRTKLSREELIRREAREIARQKLEQSLAARDLPLPRDSALDLHIDQLLLHDQGIMALASERVDARTDAYSEGLRLLGLVPEPLDLQIEI